MRVPLFALMLTVIVAACGDRAGQASGGGGVPVAVARTIPWTSAPPTRPTPVPPPTPAPPPRDIPACDPAQLRLDPGLYQGAMGGLAGAVILANTAAAPCLLAGAYTMRFIDRAGAVVLTADARPSAPGGFGDDAPGWAVAGEARLPWMAYWCRSGDPIVRIAVVYRGTTYVADEPPFTGGSVCGFGASGGDAHAYPFTPVPTPQPTTFPPPTTAPPRLRASIEAPRSVAAGSTLVYTVTLTNTSTSAVALDPCPSYVEWLGGRVIATATPPPGFPSWKPWVGRTTYAGFAKAAYALNCAAAPSIDPGASLRYEMRLAVPADALGQDTLRWSISGPNEDIAAASIVIVAAP